jgi:hypothetical protein
VKYSVITDGPRLINGQYGASSIHAIE